MSLVAWNGSQIFNPICVPVFVDEVCYSSGNGFTAASNNTVKCVGFGNRSTRFDSVHLYMLVDSCEKKGRMYIVAVVGIVLVSSKPDRQASRQASRQRHTGRQRSSEVLIPAHKP